MMLIDNQLALELLKPDHAPALFHAVDSARTVQRKFLPWVDETLRLEDYLEYIHVCQHQHDSLEELNYAVIWKQRPVGAISLQQINHRNKSACLGYWLGTFAQGQGIMTRAGARLIDHSFQVLKLHRLEIRAAIENVQSQAVAKRLGFQKEGTLRQADRIGDTYLDLNVYGLLQPEWEQARPPA